jgi:transcriptional antiterminator RfaH
METACLETNGVTDPLDVAAGEWFCAFTKPRRESFARLHLERQGVEVFLPLIRMPRLGQADVSWSLAPMFPRYLFFRAPIRDTIARVRSTRGVASVVTFGGKPGQVPAEVVEVIRGRCDGDVFQPGEPAFKRGDSVSILAGPYAGMTAIFDQRATGEERVVVLLEIMASVARVEIDRSLICAEPSLV